ELGFTASMGDASGTQTVAQGERNVMFRKNRYDVAEALVEKILFMMMSHPLREDGAATAHDARDALRHHGQILNEHAGVDSHVVDALLSLLFNHFEHYVCIEIFNPLDARNRFIDGNGSDRHGRVAQDGFANF